MLRMNRKLFPDRGAPSSFPTPLESVFVDFDYLLHKLIRKGRDLAALLAPRLPAFFRPIFQ